MNISNYQVPQCVINIFVVPRSNWSDPTLQVCHTPTEVSSFSISGFKIFRIQHLLAGARHQDPPRKKSRAGRRPAAAPAAATDASRLFYGWHSGRSLLIFGCLFTEKGRQIKSRVPAVKNQPCVMNSGHTGYPHNRRPGHLFLPRTSVHVLVHRVRVWSRRSGLEVVSAPQQRPQTVRFPIFLRS